MTFERILQMYPRVAIVGGPGVGKTTISETVQDRPVLHTDETNDLPWTDQPQILMRRIGAETDGTRFLVEGVHTARALRKGMRVDAIVHMTTERKPLTTAQRGLAKGINTILTEFRQANPSVPVFNIN